MLSAQTLALQLFITSRTISASPISRHKNHSKRSTTSQNVGSGFAIAICIVLLAGIFYYLGMRHERTKTWFSKRNAHNAHEPALVPGTITDGQKHKRQISCPLAVSSSAPIRPYDDPVEAPTPSLRYYELPIKEVHELGLPSPKKPPPTRASWLSLDRKPWWLRYPENEEQRRSASTTRSKSSRSWFKSDRSMDAAQAGVPSSSPGMIEAVNVEARHTDKEDKERKSDGSTLMDWTGLDYVRRIYTGRKSKVGL